MTQEHLKACLSDSQGEYNWKQKS
ncbi:uncharacterized protein ARMOST_03232 [Armillaria ostoyae]|uniref:Uncharacterized protein n=1 Tax=Armillaria ostoyae TaxID=47428 RepID=A0A284QU46_ARMOS|nr:uncharacterized protein ARMOST_03232 [Armillaria ostoyae]